MEIESEGKLDEWRREREREETGKCRREIEKRRDENEEGGCEMNGWLEGDR